MKRQLGQFRLPTRVQALRMAKIAGIEDSPPELIASYCQLREKGRDLENCVISGCLLKFIGFFKTIFNLEDKERVKALAG